MKSKSKVIVNSVIYSFSGLLMKCFSFFLLPLYTIYLTTEDYGTIGILSSFISTACFIVSFSLFSAILRFYVDLKDDERKLKRFYGSVVSFVFLSGITFAIILTIFKDVVSEHLFSGIDYYPLVLVTLISLTFSCQHTVFDNILRSQQRAMKSSIFSILYFLLNVSLHIFFIVYMKLGALGAMLASMIAYAVYTIYFIIEMTITRSIEFCLDFKLLKSALKYSIPIMPHNLSTHIAVFISKLLISGGGSLAELGIYTVSEQFGNISDTVQCYVNAAYTPWLYEKLHNKEENFKKTIRNNVKLLSSAIGFFLIGISLFSQDYIVLFVEEAYVNAWKYVPLIVAVYTIKTAYYFFVGVLLYYKSASRKLFWATLSGSFMNIILSYFLIPKFNVYGSIMADAISMLMRVSIVIAISRQYEDVGLKIRDFIKNFFVIQVFVVAGLFFSLTKYPTTFSIWNFGYKILITLLYVSTVFLTNKKGSMEFIKNLKNKKHSKAA